MTTSPLNCRWSSSDSDGPRLHRSRRSSSSTGSATRCSPTSGPCRQRVGFAAPAFTMRHIPAREDLDTLESIRLPGNLQWEAVERIEPGQALIIDSRGDTSAGSGGLMLMTRLARRGAVAAITDGAFRDTPDLSGIGTSLLRTRSMRRDQAVEVSCCGPKRADSLRGCGGLSGGHPHRRPANRSWSFLAISRSTYRSRRRSAKSSRPGYTDG